MTEANNKQKDRKAQQPEEARLEKSLKLGEMLKESRENSGYSIERVATATRISHPFIEALESGQLQKLPAEVFGRGFIRNLCKIYNEDPKPLLATFEEAIQGDQRMRAVTESLQPKVQQASGLFPKIGLADRILFSKTYQRLKSSPYPLALASFTALVIAAFAVWFAFKQGLIPALPMEAAKVKTESSGATSQEAQVPGGDALPGSSGPQAMVTAHAELATDTQGEKGIKDLEKQMLASEGNWVEIQVRSPVQVTIDQDGQGPNTQTLAPDNYQFPFEEVLQIRFGNTESVRLFFNGQALLADDTGQLPRRLSFRAGALDQLASN